MESLFVLALWCCLWGFLGKLIGDPKGMADTGILLGVILGPIGLLIVAVMQGNAGTPPFRSPVATREENVRLERERANAYARSIELAEADFIG